MNNASTSRKFTITDFPQNLIPFRAQKAESFEVIWADYLALDRKSPLVARSWDKKAVLDNFSYALKGNELFDEIVFSKRNSLTLHAEIYGGGLNGGGVRCGNLGEFQIKGIGQNLLVGSDCDHWHSYGGFSLIEAALELVNSLILNKALPCGTVQCYGLILTGRNTAMQPNAKPALTGKGALLIRDQCLRPAHFFDTKRFTPKHRHVSIEDSSRLKAINKTIFNEFENTNGFTNYLKDFLDKHANQFSYSKIYRIFHGAVNASNISMDGRWLDLTTASFVAAAKNYVGSEKIPSFYAEHCTVLTYTKRLISGYSNYYDVFPDFNILASFYVSKFNGYMAKHVFTLLGFSEGEWREEYLHNQDFQHLVESVWTTIVSSDAVTSPLPNTYPKNDPIVLLMEKWIDAICHYKSNSCHLTCPHLIAFLRDANAISHQKLTLLFIKSLKACLFPQFFYRNRIRDQIEKIDLNFNIYDFNRIIGEYEAAANWIFDTSEEQITIFKGLNISISYGSTSRLFIFTNSNERQEFSDAEGLIKFLNQKKYDLKILEFCFEEGILRILNAIRKIPIIF